ncbi:MAG: glycoside hydrolase family 3 C-terminal domain-containing protein [Ginsengibacter sp.]
MKNCLLLVACIIITNYGYAQANPPYKDPKLSINERVKDLLSRMTIEEKFWQMFMIAGNMDAGDSAKYKNGIFGFQVSAGSKGGNAAGQILSYSSAENALSLVRKINTMQKYFVEKSRLGIPIIPFDEALHGLVRDGATTFPQAIALAATWDTSLMARVAGAIATEAKIRGIRQVLSPVINIASDVRWGRTEETYGEDPYLTSAMGVAFVSPFEKMGIITTPKHFIANVGDGGRDSYPIHFNERILDEIYFPPFIACIKSGGSRSVMTAYNSLDGSPSTANDWLLNKKLKGDWRFGGFVISDAAATGGANVLHFTAKDYPDAAMQSVNNGLDVIFQTDYNHYKLFIPHFIDGGIDIKKIDDAVSRILKVKFELGLFEDPYVGEEDVLKESKGTTHKVLAKEAAVKSIVLLKNDHNILPLKKNIRSIAVIGPDAVEGRLGGYSGPGNGKVTILEGIKKRAGDNIKISYAEGCGRKDEQWKVISPDYLSSGTEEKTGKGLRGEYYNNITLTGTPVVIRIDKEVNFHWTLFSPDQKINNDFYSVRWTGKLRAPKNGNLKIGLDGNDGYRLYVNNVLLIDRWVKQTYSTQLKDFVFVKDRMYDIRIEFYEPVGSDADIKLIWNFGVENNYNKKIEEAVTVARNSDVTIIVAGIEEGEFRDRAMLNLPGRQEELIHKIAATGKPVMVMLVGGSAITMNSWLNNVDAVLDVWYPGEEGGNAIADILFGDTDPAGRLPVTFPLSEAQLPLVYNHKPTGRGDDYNNLSGLPLFPFGFGLSYTSFEYNGLELLNNNIAKTDSAFITFQLKNTGRREGDEVVQLYIRDLLASVARPVMELKGFRRIHLLPGEVKEVKFTLTPAVFEMPDKDLKTVVEPGDFRIMIGSSSRDIRLKTTLTIL